MNLSKYVLHVGRLALAFLIVGLVAILVTSLPFMDSYSLKLAGIFVAAFVVMLGVSLMRRPVRPTNLKR